MVTVVSGLPRSGTSLMMQILEANGFDILSDNKRNPDESNPRGYYEYEKVKSLIKDNSWINEAEGKAVKVIAQLLPYLRSNIEYKVIFMERNIDEILASQSKMLERLGSKKGIPAEILKKTFEQHVGKAKLFLEQNENFSFLTTQFKELFECPNISIQELNDTLGLGLSESASIKIIDPDLYREKF